MKTIKLFFLAAAFFACTNLPAQVTIGGLDAPRAGALLDLNSGVKGGLLLSNVNITHLDSIPAGTGYFPGVNTPALRDVNPELRGAIVYNTNETTGTGVYVWNGKRWRPAATPDNEQILFTVRTTNGGDYAIPTAGYVSGTYNHAYYWDITVDGQPAGNDNGYFHGTGEEPFTGIELTGLSSDIDHQIRITPHGGADPGWGNAFGYCDSIKGAHTTTNKQKLISIDAPLTTMAFAPKISEPGSKSYANFMFASLFIGCSKLTTPAVIKDTYKLPETITQLANFLASIHNGNSALTNPIDLSPLSGWFSGNTSITHLVSFLSGIHFNNNKLTKSINLAPLSGWFNRNTTIANLFNFLYGIHANNNLLTKPVNLTPLSGWFNGNTSITNLSNFLVNIHSLNDALTDPVDLTPLKNWFNENQKISTMSNFLNSIHHSNSVLTKPINLMPLSGWFGDNREMTNLRGFLASTHYDNRNFTLSGQFFPNWIKTMKESTTTPGITTPIWNVENAFFRTFSLSSSQSDNTEPLFEDGVTTLSSFGAPDVFNIISTNQDGSTTTTQNKGTYTNRDGITPYNNNINWK
jgi:hypothetical protein